MSRAIEDIPVDAIEEQAKLLLDMWKDKDGILNLSDPMALAYISFAQNTLNGVTRLREKAEKIYNSKDWQQVIKKK